MLFLPFLSFCTAALALSGPDSIEKRQTEPSKNCTSSDGVHIIVARATTEEPGIGLLLKPLVLGIMQFLPGSDAVGVDYPAVLVEYGLSVNIGVTNASKLIEEYAASCPDSKIVLLGYSQGAHVVGDTLCGSSSPGFIPTTPLDSKYSDNIIAIVQMGDPSHVAGLPMDLGTSTSNGLFPRTSISGCLQYINRTHSYCDAGDAYCDSGMFLSPHYQYMNYYGIDSVKYVVEQAVAAGIGASTSVSSVSAISSTSFTGIPQTSGLVSTSSSIITGPASAATSGSSDAISTRSNSGSGSATASGTSGTATAKSEAPEVVPLSSLAVLMGLIALVMS